MNHRQVVGHPADQRALLYVHSLLPARACSVTVSSQHGRARRPAGDLAAVDEMGRAPAVDGHW